MYYLPTQQTKRTKHMNQYAILFDLDTNCLTECYPGTSYYGAYKEVRDFLKDSGFKWTQGSVCFGDDMVGKTKSTIRQNKKYNLRGGEFPSGQSDKMATALSSRNRKRGVPCVALLCRGGRVGRYLGTISSL